MKIFFSSPVAASPLVMASMLFGLAIISGHAFSLKCLGCRAGAKLLKGLYLGNKTGDEIISSAYFICKTFVETSNICKGITAEFRDTFLYVLGEVEAPGELCGMLLPNCGSSHFDDGWTLPLPPKPMSKRRTWKASNRRDEGLRKFERHRRKKKLRSNTSKRRFPASSLDTSEMKALRIVQISDLHFDFDYQPGSEAMCFEPLCCSGPNPGPEFGQRTIKQPAGYWGSLANCDVPYRTIENMFQHLNESEKMDMVLFTGDYMNHRDWLYSRDMHLRVLQNLSALADEYLSGVPVYWTLGNHEGVPINQFAPHFAPDEFSPRWLYEELFENAKRHQLLPEEAAQSTKYRGSFSVLLRPGLRLISLNTGYSQTTNFFIYVNETDPDGTLSWLIDELYAAEKRREAVYIAGHIPSGTDTFEGWARNYVRIINRFADIIRAQFFGHVHFDTFSVHFEDPNNPRSRPTAVQYIAPSVTTFYNLNPAYRVYTVDSQSWEVLDFETWFMNLTDVSTRPEPSPAPAWQLLYSAREEYGLSDLSPQSWANLIDRIQRNDETSKKFFRNYFRRDNQPIVDFDNVVCALRSAHHNSSTLCQITETQSSPWLVDDKPDLDETKETIRRLKFKEWLGI